MTCEHCGSDNLDEALDCSMCGANMGDPADRLAAARQRRTRRYATGAPRIPARTRAYASVAIGAAGAYVVLSSLDFHARMPVIALAGLCGFAGVALGISVVKELRNEKGVSWPRGFAAAGTLVSACVLAAPVIVVLTVSAMFPKKLATEPLALNNLRKLSMAMQQYAQDNDGHLPGWMTDATGRSYHNVWDQQIAPYINNDAAFESGAEGPGIRSPSQPSPRSRAVGYGLNGLLITHPKAAFDGNADWASGPATTSPDALSDPSTTIVLAEVATSERMGGPYALPALQTAPPLPGDSRTWRNGLAQWVDVDPRAWVETSGPVKSYDRRQWNPNKGVGRSLHAGGACYAFADGSVGYAKLRKTVTGGIAGMPAHQFWNPGNTANMWNPR